MQLSKVEIHCWVSVNTRTFIKCVFGALKYVEYLQKRTGVLEEVGIIHLCVLEFQGCVRIKVQIEFLFPCSLSHKQGCQFKVKG